MKTKLERIVLGLILIPLAPLALFMGGWWAAYYILPETWIFLGAVFGFVLGLFADIFLLKKLLDHADALSNVFWMAIFLFYSVGFFGFFMGVPIFNVALAIPAGFVLADRLIAKKADETHVRRATRRAAGFTTTVMTFICAASAIFALIDPYTEANLQGMFALPFDVTRGMVIGLILIGGAALLILNWWLTAASARFSYRFLQRAS